MSLLRVVEPTHIEDQGPGLAVLPSPCQLLPVWEGQRMPLKWVFRDSVSCLRNQEAGGIPGLHSGKNRADAWPLHNLPVHSKMKSALWAQRRQDINPRPLCLETVWTETGWNSLWRHLPHEGHLAWQGSCHRQAEPRVRKEEVWLLATLLWHSHESRPWRDTVVLLIHWAKLCEAGPCSETAMAGLLWQLRMALVCVIPELTLLGGRRQRVGVVWTSVLDPGLESPPLLSVVWSWTSKLLLTQLWNRD